MTTTAAHQFDAEENLRYRVVATTDARLMPKLRDVLSAHASLSVVVSRAVTWDGRGPGLSVRGSRYSLDREVVRIEVTCSDRQVDAVAAGIAKVLDRNMATSQHKGSLTVQPVYMRPDSDEARWPNSARKRAARSEADAGRQSL